MAPRKLVQIIAIYTKSSQLWKKIRNINKKQKKLVEYILKQGKIWVFIKPEYINISKRTNFIMDLKKNYMKKTHIHIYIQLMYPLLESLKLKAWRIAEHCIHLISLVLKLLKLGAWRIAQHCMNFISLILKLLKLKA